MANVADELSTYERAFRALLWRYRPLDLQRGVERLLQLGSMAVSGEPIPASRLWAVYLQLRRRTIDYLVHRREQTRSGGGGLDQRSRHRTRLLLEDSIPPAPPRNSPDFHCDSGLGGLARWLRAAGYDARFWPHIDDAQLLRETSSSSAILLTTDRPLMDRSAISWGIIPALLVPLDVGKRGQFQFVARRLSLPRKSPRCMVCGGELIGVDKITVRDRIPPRTYPWLDEYYECARCGQLFWPGTHWQHVVRQLDSQ